MIEVITRWSTAGSPGGLTVMYFDPSSTAAQVRTAVATMWNAVDATLTTATSWTIDTSGRLIDEASGALTGFWNEASSKTGSGATAGVPVANSAQVLIRWFTGEVVGGRQLQGRSYVPGLATSNTVNGEVNSTAQNTILTAATALAQDSAGLLVWHRPGPNGAGSYKHAPSAGVWNELAVLRKRR